MAAPPASPGSVGRRSTPRVSGGLEALPPAALATAVVAMVFAGWIHGTLGLGFAMLATVPLALLTDVRTAILITLLPTMAVNVVSIATAERAGEALRRFWPLTLVVAGGGVLGTYWLAGLDPAPFRLLLAAVILAYLNLERLTRWRLTAIRDHPLPALVAIGLVGGVLAGTTNVMVPVLIVYALESGMRRELMVATFNLCFLAAKLAQAGTFAALGLGGQWWPSAPLALAALSGVWVGIRIRARVEAETYRGWLRRLLWVVALVLIVQYLVEVG